MTLQPIITELNTIHHCFNGYRIKCDNLVKMFDKKHPSFFKELNVLFRQTENNYNFLNSNQFYLYFVDRLNLIFSMFNSNPDDKNISDVLTQLSEETKKYLFDIEKIIKELQQIDVKISKLKTNTF